MADNLRKYTTQEVLNKVYTDSSGNSIGLNAATSKETLNAVLTSGSDSLNVALSGGTISGDVTISGDLTVSGGGTMTYSETVTDNVSGNYAMFIENQHSNGLGLAVRAGASGDINILSLQNATQATMFAVKTNGNVSATGSMTITQTASNSAALTIDHNSSQTTNVTNRSMHIDFDKTSNTGSGHTVNMSGLQIDMNNDSATDVGTTNLTGLDVNMTMGTSGTQKAVGLDISVLGADNNYPTIFTDATNIAHGMTDLAPTSSYAYFLERHSTQGGLTMIGATDADSTALTVGGIIGVTDPGDTVPAIILQSGKKSGTTGQALAAAETVLRVDNWDSTGLFTILGNASVGIGNAGISGIGLNVTGKIRVSDKIEVNSNNFLIQTATVTAIDGASDTLNMNFSNAASTGDSHRGFLFSAAKTACHIDGQGNLVFKSTADSGADVGNGASLYLQKDDGQPMANNDVLGEIIFQGSEDTSNNLISGARIFAHNSRGSAWDASNNHCDLVFATTTGDGSTGSNLAERMRITDDGDVHFGADNYDPLIQDGSGASAGNVGYSFKGDTDTGMTSGAESNIIHFVTGANARMILDNNCRISLSNNDQGESNNTVFGKSAFNVSGNNGSDYNTVVGELAMGTNAVSGSTYNVALGYKALTEAIDCDFNIAIGANSMLVADSGESNNISIGTNAMNGIDNSGSDYNVVIGDSALLGGTGIVQKNIAIGANAMGTGVGDNAQTGTVAIGHDSLQDLTDGSGNTMVGYQSGRLMTTAGSNTVLGYQAMASNLTGTYNVAIGKESMIAAAHGESNNIAIGAGSLGNAKENVAAGAGHAHTLDDNIGIGRNALLGGNLGTADSILTHQGNIAIGSYALDATAGNPHLGTIAIGYQSLTSHTSIDGSEPNTAIGYQSAFNTTTGGANTVLGYHAFRQSTQDSCNTAIGKEALYAMNGSGTVNAYNTALGYRAGDGISTGIENTGLGAHTAFDIDANNQTAVGYQATCSMANQIMLGNSDVTTCYIGGGATTNYSTDTEGAYIYAQASYLKKRIAYNHGGSTALLTLHGSFNDSPSGNTSMGIDFTQSAEDTNYGAVMSRITCASRSGLLGSGGAGYGTELEFYNINNGSLVKQMSIQGGDNRRHVIIRSDNNGSGGGPGLYVYNDGDDVNRTGIEIHAGKDTLGTNADAVWLDFQSGDGDDIATIQYVHSGVTAGIVAASDERLKENIKDTSIKGVETIDSLKLREFNWKSEVNRGSDKIKVGLIAQEVEKIDDISDMVIQGGKFGEKRDSDDVITQEAILDDVKSIEWTSSIPYLIKAVQELSARVKELESK